jgi:hypothetical protein
MHAGREVEGPQGPLKVLVKSLVNYYAKINYFIGAPFEFCNLRDPNQECIKRYPGPPSCCFSYNIDFISWHFITQNNEISARFNLS